MIPNLLRRSSSRSHATLWVMAPSSSHSRPFLRSRSVEVISVVNNRWARWLPFAAFTASDRTTACAIGIVTWRLPSLPERRDRPRRG